MVGAVRGITLALDAATYDGSVAVLRDGVTLAEAVVAMRGETEERLMPAVLEAIGRAGVAIGDVARVVCGAGPGSFTSLRIAGAIAKGIAFGNDIPMFAASSLALVVAGAEGLAHGDYLAVLDAMRGERYVAPFRRRSDGRVVPAGDAARVPAAEVAGVAARFGALAIGPLEARVAAPHPRGVARLLDAIVAAGPVDLDAWEPAYGRLAEAQVKWEAAHGRPLVP
ncbi:MAG TPA: tRNA (adenosine(37)-N6)-threonylcarbamoyltransferase complex dimerization subunit type 1 TsaB [Gemmatimonadaceae bacterium]|nr:tRNA (adenosine(37)-N6)-threonylcarbamoyltransferase complex dimerization subunit type 1 TsaB [Gemmatimonadaceae bacterium]